ncbi:MAG: RimK/LysX family protein [Bdellovibrionota bacterium]
MKKKQPLIVGWWEWVSIPELSIHSIKAKMDTGAKTSALHATHIVEIQKRGVSLVEFTVHLPHQQSKRVRRPLVDERNIKSSLGQMTLRPIVEVHLHLRDLIFPIELSLIDRSLLGFELLLGRRALKKRMLINPSKSNMLQRGEVF